MLTCLVQANSADQARLKRLLGTWKSGKWFPPSELEQMNSAVEPQTTRHAVPPVQASRHSQPPSHAHARDPRDRGGAMAPDPRGILVPPPQALPVRQPSPPRAPPGPRPFGPGDLSPEDSAIMANLERLFRAPLVWLSYREAEALSHRLLALHPHAARDFDILVQKYGLASFDSRLPVVPAIPPPGRGMPLLHGMPPGPSHFHHHAPLPPPHMHDHRRRSSSSTRSGSVKRGRDDQGLTDPKRPKGPAGHGSNGNHSNGTSNGTTIIQGNPGDLTQDIVRQYVYAPLPEPFPPACPRTLPLPGERCFPRLAG